MKFFTTTALVIFSLQLFSQDHKIISLSEFIIDDFDDRHFYFDQIITDEKADIVGYSKLDTQTKVSIIKFELGLKGELEELLAKSLPKKEEQIALNLIVEELTVLENSTSLKGSVAVIFHAQINLGDTILYSNKLEKEFVGDFFIGDYPRLITTTIKEFMYDFAMVPDELKLKQVTKAVETDDSYDQGERNVTAVGYQIGGFALIGINYEFRATDNIGIHVGAGYRGFTAGIKVHWRPTKDGGFINISFKDGGFGLISGWAVEYGSRKAFGKNEGTFGFHYQVGLTYITHLSPELSNFLGGAEAPFPSISFGAGFSW